MGKREDGNLEQLGMSILSRMWLEFPSLLAYLLSDFLGLQIFIWERI